MVAIDYFPGISSGKDSTKQSRLSLFGRYAGGTDSFTKVRDCRCDQCLEFPGGACDGLQSKLQELFARRGCH
jgi:hypothetical protein